MTTIRRRPLVVAFALLAAIAVAIPTFGVGRASAVDSQVYLVHGIPGVPVDVYAGGTAEANKVLTDFQPGTVEGPLPIPEGPLPVVVVATGDDPTVEANQVINQTLDVPGGANLSVVANVEGDTPNLQAFANDLSAVAEGSSRVTVRHTADAPTVDIAVNGEVAIPGLAPGTQASAVLPAGTYDFSVLAGGSPVLNLPGTEIPPAKNVIVYAVGSADPDSDFPLGTVVQVLDVPVTPAPAPAPAPAPDHAAPVAAAPRVTG